MEKLGRILKIQSNVFMVKFGIVIMLIQMTIYGQLQIITVLELVLLL